MKKFPWLDMQKKADPEPPFEPPMWFGNRSNGEFFRYATRRERKMRKLILERADENARRLGVDRRQFMASAMGMCTSLLVMSEVGCSSDDSSSAGSGGAGGMGGGGMGDGGMAGGGASGGGAGGAMSGGAGGGDAGATSPLCIPPEAQYDEQAACDIIGGNEFIFDVQTHWFKAEDLERFPGYLAVFPSVGELTEDLYIDELFLQSDTTISVLTSWPGIGCYDTLPTGANCGMPLANPSMVASRNNINQLSCNTERVIQHVQLMIQDEIDLGRTKVPVEELHAIMDEMHCEHKAYGWKLYPGAFNGFWMNEARARSVIEHGLDIGVPIFCVHKGLPIGQVFNHVTNYPSDIGIVAKDYPEAKFVVYHSAINAGHPTSGGAPPEGPYDPSVPLPYGVNALLKSLDDNGITPGSNVYAEVGTAIGYVDNDVEQARHFWGKLMKHVGVDNVVWGTDSILGGSPQRYIEWFRSLDIPQDMQAQYDYPPLNAENKAKILGLNAAALYGIDVEATRCQVDTCATAQLKQKLDEEYGPRRWMFREPHAPKTYDEFVTHNLKAAAEGMPG